MSRLFRRLVAGGVMLLAAWPATAQDAWCGTTLCLAMQPGFAEVRLTNSPPVVTLPDLGGSVSGDYSTGRAGWLPLPFVDIESEIDGDSRRDLNDTNVAQTYLHYQAMVVSKVPFTGTLLVPVTVQGDYVLGTAATPGSGRGGAAVLLKAGVGGAPSFTDSVDSNDCALSGPLRACTRVGGFSLAGQVRVGTAFSLDLYAFASSESFRRLGLAQGRAFLDPLVGIDPAFAGADSFFVVVSAGAGNTAPVPEPNSLPMWLAGATALAAAGRRARRAAQSEGPGA